MENWHCKWKQQSLCHFLYHPLLDINIDRALLKTGRWWFNGFFLDIDFVFKNPDAFGFFKETLCCEILKKVPTK